MTILTFRIFVALLLVLSIFLAVRHATLQHSLRRSVAPVLPYFRGRVAGDLSGIFLLLSLLLGVESPVAIAALLLGATLFCVQLVQIARARKRRV